MARSIFNVLVVLAVFGCGMVVNGHYQACQAGQKVLDSCGQRCVCTSRGTLVNCTRIRHEFTTMTTAERERYVRVVKTASNDTRYKSQYDALISLNKKLFFRSGNHQRQHFLTWHRWYVLQYENLLRQIDCNITVPYWDWSVVAGNPWSATPSDLWYSGNSGFGGNGVPPGRCVQTGPFRKGLWELAPSVSPPRCLKRDFSGKPPDSTALAQLLNTPASQFNTFELSLRGGFNAAVSCMIGGTMCTTDTAAAPEFFLHQSFVDKIWTDWQVQSYQHKIAFFSTLTSTLPETNGLLPKQVINQAALPGEVRVEYA